METKISSPNSYTRVFEVTFTNEEISEKLKEKYENYQKSIAMPGFRPGRTPIGLLKSYFGEAIKEELADEIVKKTYEEILEKEKLNPIIESKIKPLGKVEENSPFTFTIEFEIKPEVKLNNYKGYKLEKRIKEVTDRDVEQAIDRLRERYARFTKLQRQSQMNDYIAFSYIDEKDQKIEVSLHISEDEKVLGIEELVGLKEGDKKGVRLVFPQDFPKEIAGRTIDTEIEVNGVYERHLPDDEELLKALNGPATMEELRTKVKNELESIARDTADRALEESLTELLVRDNPVEVPPSLVRKAFYEIIRSRYGEQTLRKLSAEELERLEADMRPILTHIVAKELILEAVAKAENLTVDDSDYEKLADRLGSNAESVRGLMNSGEFEDAKGKILSSKALKLILDSCTITELKVKE